METDGFTVVKKKHAAKRNNNNNNNNNNNKRNNNKINKFTNPKIIGNIVEDNIDLEIIINDIETKRRQIKCSQIFKDIKNLMERWRIPEEVVSYGLGNISADRIAKHQFAMLLCLVDHLQLHTECCLTYDPCHSEADFAIIRHYRLTRISFNEEGKHRSTTPTLYFMPHCGRPLYNNLLWINWNAHNLGNTCVLGNSFNSIVNNNSENNLLQYYPCIHKIKDVMQEWSLLNSFEQNDTFNNLSLHLFDFQNNNNNNNYKNNNNNNATTANNINGVNDDNTDNANNNNNNNNNNNLADIFASRPAEVEYGFDDDIIKA